MNRDEAEQVVATHFGWWRKTEQRTWWEDTVALVMEFPTGDAARDHLDAITFIDREHRPLSTSERWAVVFLLAVITSWIVWGYLHQTPPPAFPHPYR